MTTPFPVTSVQVGNSPDEFWGGVPGAPALLLINLDDTDNITVGPKGIAPNAPNGYTIPAQASISLPGTSAWSAVTDSPEAPLLMQVLPGGAAFSPSALAIAGQIAASGLAVAIAEEIAAAGISLISAPIPLYGTNQVPAGAGLVGASIFQAAYGSANAIEASNTFNAKVGVPICNNVRVAYYHDTQPQPVTAANDTQNIAGLSAAPPTGLGCHLIATWHMPLDPTNAYTDPIYATAFNNLVTSIQYVAGAAAQGVDFVLINEPNVYLNGVPQMTPAQYLAHVNFYGPAFKIPNQASNYNLFFKPGLSQPNAPTYYPGASGSGPHGNWTIDGYLADSYCQDYTKKAGGQNFVDALMACQAQADAAGIPFGMGEWGLMDGSNPNNIPTATEFVSWNSTYIRGLMAARLAAGKPNAPVIWFANGPFNSVLDGANSISSAAIIAEIVATFNALSAEPVPTVTIGPNATAVLHPLNPSPGAGYAIADGISYDILLILKTSTGSTNPYASVNVKFPNADISGASGIDTMQWEVPMGGPSSSGTVISGIGPQRGQFMKVQITNNDTVNCTVEVFINSTSRSVAKDNWSWDAPSSVSIPGTWNGSNPVSLPDGDVHANSLGSVQIAAVPANTTVYYLLSLFAGRVWVQFSTGSAQMSVKLYPAPTSEWGGANTPAIWSPAAAAGTVSTELILPRAPVVAAITNADLSNTHDAHLIAVAEN